MKRRNEYADGRIKAKHVTWIEYAITYAVLSVLSAGQAMIFVEYMGGTQRVPIDFILGMMGYWAIVTFIFCVIINRHIWKHFFVPMRRLGDAARNVAEGDFTVYLEPIHTEDKQDFVDVMYRDFNTMVEKLGTMEILQSDFITNASHEMRAPVAVVQSSAQLLQSEGLSDEDRMLYTENILSASRRLSALMTDILMLGRLDSGAALSGLDTYDLIRQLTDCILYFEDVLDEKNLGLSIEIEDSVMITADRGMLEIVWKNLLANAIKYTSPGGTVSLRQERDGDTIVVAVDDTGVGMSEDTMAHMFDRFYQGDLSHSECGNGLGLSLVIKALAYAGGSIAVESILGKGSRFTVRVPVRQEVMTDGDGI